MGNPTAPVAMVPAFRRPRCEYGEKCFRKNPEHKAQFTHPCDADWHAMPEKVSEGYSPAFDVVLPPPASASEMEARKEKKEKKEKKDKKEKKEKKGKIEEAAESLSDADGEDRGVLGAVGGAAAGLGAGVLAGKHLKFAKKHPGLALAIGAAAVVAGGVAGSKLEDELKASGSKPGDNPTSATTHASPSSRPMCKYFAAGHCRDGERCKFSHMAASTHGRRLVVRVKNATKLRNTDGPFAGKSDPYVVLRLLDSRGRTVAGPKQTRVIKDDLNPVWNEDITFDGLDTPAAYTLAMAVYDQDTFLGTGHLDWLSKDDRLGEATVPLGTLYNTTDYQDRELTIERRALGFVKAQLNISLNTCGQWGN